MTPQANIVCFSPHDIRAFCGMTSSRKRCDIWMKGGYVVQTEFDGKCTLMNRHRRRTSNAC